MPRAGLKNRILYLQKPTLSTSSGSGEATEAWTNIGPVYAEVTPQNGAEKGDFNQTSASIRYKVRVNYRTDITPQRRFLMEDFAGQLNGAVTSGTSITVDDSTFALFEQARRLRVLCIDSELMLITGTSGNTFTVTRAQFGTTQANHADDSKVILYRQLNIASVIPTSDRMDLICDCLEVV